MDLTHMIDQFLDERLEGRRMSLRQASRFRFWLVGDSTLSRSRVGFAIFLKATGVETPKLRHINSHQVGRYWEYLIQHHGGLAASRAMRALRAFWTWCVTNGYIKDLTIPPDLKSGGSGDIYRILTTIQERISKGGQS